MRSAALLAIIALSIASFAYIAGSGFDSAYLNYYYGAQNCMSATSYHSSGQQISKGDGTVVFYKYTDDGVQVGTPDATNGTIGLNTMSSWLSSSEYQHTEGSLVGVDNEQRMLEARNVCREYAKSAADAMVSYIDSVSPYAGPAEAADLKQRKRLLERASASLGPGAQVSDIVWTIDNADGDWEIVRKTASPVAARAACAKVNAALASESSLAYSIEGEIKIAEMKGKDAAYARALLIGARARIGDAFERCSSLQSAKDAAAAANEAEVKLRQALAELDGAG
jgi:hypothetical protein